MTIGLHRFAAGQKWVLVDNVGIPTFVQDLSHARIYPINVLPMS